MADDSAKRRLGRGLAALIGEMDEPVIRRGEETSGPTHAPDRTVPVEFITRNPGNPRRNFNDEDLSGLARSMMHHGIVQPLVVRPAANGKYELIAGERRWRAAQKAGLDRVPIIVRDIDDRAALEIAIVENVQRVDLNPVEEASGYDELIQRYDYTQIELADLVGKSRSHVANTLRLLALPEDVLAMVGDGRLTAGHARALITVDDPKSIADQIVAKDLSVREAESLAKRQNAGGDTGRKGGQGETRDADTAALEKRLSDNLGLGVSIGHKGETGGQIRIAYRTLEQLDEVCRRLESR